jgi:hypothetical protein
MPRGLAVAAVITIIGTLASGCQSNPEPPPLQSASSSPPPSPTASASAAAPTLPAKAKGTSEAAAKAFVRHYIETVNYAMRTGETAYLSRLARPGCTTCNAIVARIDEVYDAGGRLEGRGWSVLSLTFHPPGPQADVLVAVGVNIAPQITYADKRASPSHSAMSRGNLDFRLSTNARAWIVKSLEATQ